MIRRIVVAGLLLSLFICLAVPIGLNFYNQSPPQPVPKWNHSSGQTVLIIDRYLGEIDCAYMPILQIRGNGQAYKVEYDKRGNRRVLEATFSEQELQKIIDDFIQAGFFDDDTRYDAVPATGEEYILLSLENDVVHGALLDENEAVKTLVEQLLGRFEAKSQEYVPPEGVLNVYQIDSDLEPDTDVQTWPDEEFGYTLGEVLGEQKFLQGDEMLFAWNITNSENRFVESGGDVYWLCVSFE